MNLAMSVFVHFLSGMVIAFLGALPFGTVNLSVVDVTLRKTTHAGILMSVGAALIEIAHASIAFHCSDLLLPVFNQPNRYLKWGSLALLMAIGLFFFLKKASATPARPKINMPPFLKGMLLSAINPQAIPFWLATFSWLLLQGMFSASNYFFIPFVVGVAAGRFGSLWTYVLLSKKLSARSSLFQQKLNRILAFIFWLLATLQFIAIVQA